MRKRIKQGLKSTRKFYHGIGDIKRAWKKAGGVVIPANRYLIGYKVIPIGPEMAANKYNLVQLRFNKFFTGGFSKKGRNKGGKKDILVRASDKDLLGLRTEGVEYY